MLMPIPKKGGNPVSFADACTTGCRCQLSRTQEKIGICISVARVIWERLHDFNTREQLAGPFQHARDQYRGRHHRGLHGTSIAQERFLPRSRAGWRRGQQGREDAGESQKYRAVKREDAIPKYDSVPSGPDLTACAARIQDQFRVCHPGGTNGLRCSSPVLKNYHLINCSGRRQFASQLCGTFTYERSSSSTDAQPSSLNVRSRSARRISMARMTPASPAAARP
jgi:hypothetical protein